jgi:hypothetical protein
MCTASCLLVPYTVHRLAGLDLHCELLLLARTGLGWINDQIEHACRDQKCYYCNCTKNAWYRLCTFFPKKRDRRDLDNNAGDSDKVDKIVLISRS